MTHVQLLVADDRALTRSAIVAMIEESGGFDVAAQTHDLEAAVDAVDAIRPDIIVLNVRSMSGSDLMAFVERIDAEVDVVVLRCHDSSIETADALRAKIAGFADLEAVEENLTAVIELVSRGCTVCAVAAGQFSFVRFIGNQGAHPVNRGISSLTPRELEVLHLVTDDFTNREIGLKLHITETTVKKHLSRAMRKLSVSSRVGAALAVARSDF